MAVCSAAPEGIYMLFRKQTAFMDCTEGCDGVGDRVIVRTRPRSITLGSHCQCLQSLSQERANPSQDLEMGRDASLPGGRWVSEKGRQREWPSAPAALCEGQVSVGTGRAANAPEEGLWAREGSVLLCIFHIVLVFSVNTCYFTEETVIRCWFFSY